MEARAMQRCGVTVALSWCSRCRIYASPNFRCRECVSSHIIRLLIHYSELARCPAHLLILMRRGSDTASISRRNERGTPGITS